VGIRYNDKSRALRLFGEFLTASGIDPVGIDEAMLEDFAKHLAGKPGFGKAGYRNTLCQTVRELTNRLPDSICRRPLMNERDLRRIRRFYHLTPRTQAVLKDFLRDGRRVRVREGAAAPVLSDALLSQQYRETVVENALNLMRQVGVDDICSVTPEIVTAFIRGHADQGRRQTAIHLLADVRPLFSNLWARGLVSGIPFDDTVKKVVGESDDFVPPEGIEALRNLSTLDRDDFSAVRNRLICFGLCYDVALRCGEVVRLKADDITVEDFVGLTLRPEVQKGRKRRETMLNFFPETRELMVRYLEMREALHPATDALIVSDRGQPMLDGGCRTAVRVHCDPLGLKTNEGRGIYPHALRHTFGTLNSGSLGLRLDPYDLMRRLRHTSVELTMRVYVNNNPLLKRQRHIATVNGYTGTDHSRRIETKPRPAVVSDFMPEVEALQALSHLGITWQGLQKYGMDQGAARRNGTRYEYPRGLIEDLASNWVTKETVMKTLGFGRSRFHCWVRSRAVTPIQIGRVSLLRAKDMTKGPVSAALSMARVG
jgi:integrase